MCERFFHLASSFEYSHEYRFEYRMITTRAKDQKKPEAKLENEKALF